MTALLHQLQNCFTLSTPYSQNPIPLPFCAFAFSLKSSDDVANTRRCNSSNPISPSVSLWGFTIQHKNIHMGFVIEPTHPAKTPPARTRNTLMMSFDQNSEGSVVGVCSRGILIILVRYGEANAVRVIRNMRVGKLDRAILCKGAE
jgi:hypothetical protein